MAFTKRYQEEIEGYQLTIDNLTLEVTAAKMEIERLKAECEAWDQGRDDLILGHQAEIAEYLEKMQELLERLEVCDKKIGSMQDTVSHHQMNCLLEFKNYTLPNEDVTSQPER